MQRSRSSLRRPPWPGLRRLRPGGRLRYQPEVLRRSQAVLRWDLAVRHVPTSAAQHRVSVLNLHRAVFSRRLSVPAPLVAADRQ
jgi:hypothetical protein